MSLPLSGPISLQDMSLELTNLPATPRSLNEPLARCFGGKKSGSISMSDLRGSTFRNFANITVGTDGDGFGFFNGSFGTGTSLTNGMVGAPQVIFRGLVYYPEFSQELDLTFESNTADPFFFGFVIEDSVTGVKWFFFKSDATLVTSSILTEWFWVNAPDKAGASGNFNLISGRTYRLWFIDR